MISSYVKKQLMVFAVLTVAAILIIVFVYAKVPSALGIGRMTVSATFTNGAGIYPDSNVTVRGVGAGIVKKVELTPQGQVLATMSVDKSTPVGADARAEIHSVSAVGEQYIDLISDQPAGPYLQEGASIPVSRTRVPEQIAPVLDKTTKLLASIPNAGLQTFLDEGYKAFGNLGPDFRTLVDSAQNLVATADENYTQTSQLIRDIGPLLDTQNIAATDVKAYFKNLAGTTDVLREESDHFRSAFTTVRDAAKVVHEGVEDLREPVSYLSPHLRKVGKVLGVYHDSIEQILVQYPVVAAWEQIFATPSEGRGLHAALAFNNAELSPSCTDGFNGKALRSPEDISDKDAEPSTYCKIPHDDKRLVRGARNAVCQEGPMKGQRAGTVDICLGRLPASADVTPGSNSFVNAPGKLPIPGSTGNPFPQSGPFTPKPNQTDYDQDDLSSSDPLSAFGGASSSGKDQSWQSLLSGPTGH